MNMITAKCPACGAMHAHPGELVEQTATCGKCGTIYCEVNPASESAEASREAARSAKNCEARLDRLEKIAEQTARQVRFIYRAVDVAILLIVVEMLLRLLGCVQ